MYAASAQCNPRQYLVFTSAKAAHVRTGRISMTEGHSISIAGEDVAGEEDCLYAADLRLSRIVLEDCDSRQSVALLVERSGGDSMCLQAPPQVWCLHTGALGSFVRMCSAHHSD